MSSYAPTPGATSDKAEWKEDGDVEGDGDGDDEDGLFASGRKRPGSRRSADDVDRTKSAIRYIEATTLDEEASVSKRMIKRYIEPRYSRAFDQALRYQVQQSQSTSV